MKARYCLLSSFELRFEAMEKAEIKRIGNYQEPKELSQFDEPQVKGKVTFFEIEEK